MYEDGEANDADQSLGKSHPPLLIFVNNWVSHWETERKKEWAPSSRFLFAKLFYYFWHNNACTCISMSACMYQFLYTYKHANNKFVNKCNAIVCLDFFGNWTKSRLLPSLIMRYSGTVARFIRIRKRLDLRSAQKVHYIWMNASRSVLYLLPFLFVCLKENSRKYIQFCTVFLGKMTLIHTKRTLMYVYTHLAIHPKPKIKQ